MEVGPRKEPCIIDTWKFLGTAKDPGVQIGQAWAGSAFCREVKASVKTGRRKARVLFLGRRGRAAPGKSILKVNTGHLMKAKRTVHYSSMDSPIPLELPCKETFWKIVYK